MSESDVRSATTPLEVFDMATSLTFYRALGCEVVLHWGEQEDESEWNWVLLRLGDASLMLNTRYGHQVSQSRRQTRRIRQTQR